MIQFPDGEAQGVDTLIVWYYYNHVFLDSCAVRLREATFGWLNDEQPTLKRYHKNALSMKILWKYIFILGHVLLGI